MSRAKLARSVVDTCADCGAIDPTWASINKGILVCDECCSVHRTLGRHVSHIKSLRKGTWIPSQLAMVHALHNNGANTIWEHSLLDPTNSKSSRKKPQAKDPLKPNKSDFIRTKHQLLGFVYRGGNKENEIFEGQDSDISKQLHSSVRTANLETSLRLLSCGADPNYLHPEKGTTPLHVAAGAGQASQVELLLVYGADPGAFDSFGRSPIDHANDAGYKDVGNRLLESQYEVTDRMSYYLCERKPDHLSGHHFLIPEMADAIDSNSEAARNAKRKLQMLPNYLFEEIAMDIYDEVDRRETEQFWMSLQGSNGAVDRGPGVPFLPVNAELSATRNQARQKLGRLNPREFTTLLIDVLSEAKRRQLGGLRMSTKSALMNSRPDVSDDEPLYDSVASEEEYVMTDLPMTVPEPVQDKNSKTSPVKNVVSIEAYMEIKEQLSLSNVRMQELLASNTSMQSQISQLQNMVQSLVQENSNLKTQPSHQQQTTNKGTSSSASTSPAKSPEEPVTLRGSKVHGARHFSMYETREGLRTQDASRTLQTSDEVFKRTNLITRRIQEVFRNVQDRKHDLIEPCALRIVEAVQSVVAIVPQTCTEEVRSCIQLLNSSAARLLSECREIAGSATQSDQAVITQRVIQGAYEVAKATKQLVTLFQS